VFVSEHAGRCFEASQNGLPKSCDESPVLSLELLALFQEIRGDLGACGGRFPFWDDLPRSCFSRIPDLGHARQKPALTKVPSVKVGGSGRYPTRGSVSIGWSHSAESPDFGEMLYFLG